MSWWNTSNITDLASKALKNAQQKIDKALDINDGAGGKSTPAEASTAASGEQKPSDFFSSFMGGDGQPSSEDPSKSAWSFPWGAGGEKEAEANPEPVREKTAEEIKSEVLKAAKERKKAKAKLFPQKKPSGDSLASLTESVKKTSSDESGRDSDSSIEKDSMKVSQVLEQKLEISVAKEDKGHDSSGQIEPDSASHADIAKIQVEASDGKLSPQPAVPEIPIESTQETLNLSDSQVDMQGSCFQEISEYEAEIEEQITDFAAGKEEKSEIFVEDTRFLDTPREERVIDKPVLSSPTEESVIEQRSDPTEQEPVTLNDPGITISLEVSEDKSDESDYCKESGASFEPSPGDISSSVEFVTEKDLTVENEESDNVINKDSDSGDQSSSDPELVDYDRTADEDAVNESAEIPSTVIKSDELLLKVYLPETEGENVDTKEESSLNDYEKTQAVAEVESDPSFSADLVQLTDSVGLDRNSSSSDIESSSANKLDLSMDTCTSEETIVDVSSQYDSDSKSSSSTKITAVAECCEESEETTEHSEKPDQAQELGTDKVEGNISVDVHDVKKDDSERVREEEKAELSPANSFVKCMLEDAIDDSKHDDNSDSHSTEKSDGSRSVYSNQESSDEIDTTTSSDIEIISLPTPNGENRQASPLDPVPLRIALQKTNWRVSPPMHRRTDSSGSSNNSKDGGFGELSPGRDHMEYTEYSKTHQEPSDAHRHQHDLPALDEEDDNPYHPQRLLKEETKMESHDSESRDLGSHDSCTDLDQAKSELPSRGEAPAVHVVYSSRPAIGHNDHNGNISLSHEPVTNGQHSNGFSEKHHSIDVNGVDKMGEMAEVLQAREEKLLQVSKENCDLMESNSILRNQLKQSEEAREAEMADVNELTTEFTDRLTEAEKRVTAAIREKDQYKSQLGEVQSELAKRAGDVSLKQILIEKEEQIQELLQEGEKLSKSQLQSNTIIKKLRQKEKDNDSTISTQKKKLDTQKEELDHLHLVLESKEELEKKQTEAISQLNSAVNKQEQEMVRLKSEHEDAVEKARGLQVALDNSYKEMAELHRNSAAQDSKAQEAALSAETHVREELKMTIEKLQKQTKWEKESLNMQIEDLRLSMARQEKDHNRREDLLKQEIADLQKQLQEDEARTQELTQGVSLATRPLLRQIENLQSTYNAQSATWERVERNISDRLAESQNQLAIMTEKERTANDQLLELRSKVTSLETQVSRLKQERAQMAAQLEVLKTKVETTEDAKQNEAAQIEIMKQQMEKQMSDLKREKILLETQLDVEKSKVEQEKKKVLMIQDQMRNLELEMARSKSRGTPVLGGSPSPRSVSRQDSMVSSVNENSFLAITQDELDRSFVLSSPNGNKQSLYEALRQSGAANLLENLQSQLKLREGEIIHLQGEIRTLERTRESMAKELVDLSNRNDDLEETAKEVPVLTEQYQELDQRYNALLQMYGEKVEESNELRLDLQDIKEMYKTQINQLVGGQG